jgi:hypothetical protein
MSEYTNYSQRPLAVIGGLHGNELGVTELARAIEEAGIPGVISIVGHPEAASQGKRFLDDGLELGSLFPGSDDQDAGRDRRRAAALHHWLERHDPWLILSLHSNLGETADSEYCAVNPATTPQALAVGSLLNIDKYMVIPDYPLYVHHPRIVEVDQVITPHSDIDSITDDWLHALREISRRGPEGMASLYNQESGSLQYYQLLGAVALGYNGRPAPTIEVLESLEKLILDEELRSFMPLPLTAEQRQALELPDASYSTSAWNYHHMAPILPPEYGVSTQGGHRRRQFLGEVLLRLEPPQPTSDGRLVFNITDRPGLLMQ